MMKNEEVKKNVQVIIGCEINQVANKIRKQLLMTKGISVIGCYYDGESLMEGLKYTKPDVAIIDPIISGIDGLTIMENTKLLDINTKFIVVSDISDRYFISKCFESGAKMYLINPCKDDTLVNAVKRITKRNESLNDIYISWESEQDINSYLSSLLKSLGFAPHLTGYKYAMYGIMKAYEDETLLSKYTCLYQNIAKHFNTTASGVERSIRHCIETGFKNCRDSDLIDKLFPSSRSWECNGKPYNSELIASVVDVLNREFPKRNVV